MNLGCERKRLRLIRQFRWLRTRLLTSFVIAGTVFFAATLILFPAGADQTEPTLIGILYLVDSTGDGDGVGPSTDCDDGTGHCTLRAAIESSNLHSGTDGISFNIPTSDPGYSNGVWTINLSRALPDLSDPVTISGPGADKLTVQRSTASNTPDFRIFNVTTNGTVSLSGMTIANGMLTNADGGGIENASTGTISVSNCSIIGNQAVNGGGIANDNSGQVNVTSCTIDQNTAQSPNGYCSGGGIYNPSGTVSITNSLVESNLAEALTSGFGSFGGGVFNNGTLSIVNSTIFDNLATSNSPPGYGGGIFNTGTTTISNSTIARNDVPGGQAGVNASGVQNQGTAKVKSSIIARNSGLSRGQGSIPSDVIGDFLSSGYNLVGIRDGSTGFTAATDQTGTAAAPLDPKFELAAGFPLVEDNGGPTKTMALVCGSPAIDKGTSNGLTGTLTTDQRGTGFVRTVDYSAIPNASGGDGTDIGAFEFGAGPIVPTSVVSRKYHGLDSSAPHFDIPLPLSCASMGVECRRNTAADTSGPNAGHDHELIVTFGNNVAVANVDVVDDATDLLTGSASFSVTNNVVTVDLHSIPNAVRLNVNLRGVTDGTNAGLVSIPMGVLLGDVNGSARVDAADVSLVRQQTLQMLTTSNFKEDINVSGRVDAADVSVVRQQTLTSLP